MSRRDYEEDDYDSQYDKEDFSEIKQKRHVSERKAAKGKKHNGKHGGSLSGIFALEREQTAEEREIPWRQTYPTLPKTAFKTEGTVAAPATSAHPYHTERTYGPNTMEFLRIKIDFDGVVSISTLPGSYNGYPSYGLKFSFKGYNSPSKTIWYRSSADRDADCARAAAFFKKLRGAK